MLTLATFEALLTARGQEALASASARRPAPATLLADIQALRTRFDADLAAAAIETVMLRERAAVKFSRAAQMFFTRDALEQATAEPVSRYRATRFQTYGQVWDLCCSIGGDLINLAAPGRQVTGLDLDPLRLRMAAWNADVYGVGEQVSVEEGDVEQWSCPPGAAIFFDPGRRQAGRRIANPRDYQPSLTTLEAWLPQAAGMGVKVAPGLDYDRLPWAGCEVEIVSLGGEVKEAVLWLGALAHGTRTATMLPAGVSLVYEPVEPIEVRSPRGYLYEPDGAVIRAHLVEQLATRIGATKIDPEIAFLASDTRVETPFARAFRIDEVMPFNLKRLRSWLRERAIGHVVVKKRGSPIDPQVLEHQLRPEGDNSAVVVLTHVLGKPSVLICDVTS